jgi:hypothetical protein
MDFLVDWGIDWRKGGGFTYGEFLLNGRDPKKLLLDSSILKI